MKHVIKLSAITAMLALGGCANCGHSFDISKVSELHPGITTEADAKSLFGEPIAMKAGSNGGHILLWSHIFATGLATGSGEKLEISFGVDGRMIRIEKMAKV